MKPYEQMMLRAVGKTDLKDAKKPTPKKPLRKLNKTELSKLVHVVSAKLALKDLEQRWIGEGHDAAFRAWWLKSPKGIQAQTKLKVLVKVLHCSEFKKAREAALLKWKLEQMG